MRIAVLSDIHGNLTAFEAVAADILSASPDLVIVAGDIADGCSNGAAVIDRIREFGWPALCGNADDMLFHPQSLEDFAATSQAPPSIWEAIRTTSTHARQALGPDRLHWLSTLPMSITHEDLAVVHASPQSCWQGPTANATDEALHETFAPINKPIVAYGHIHTPFIRTLAGTPNTVINTGSVGLPFDGDHRAAYLLLDNHHPTIRRVPYDLDREISAIQSANKPHADWAIRILRTAAPQLP